jgi:hypothetical protein
MLELRVSKPYVCQFCSHKYMQEKTLAVHMCEQKRRYLAKDTKHVVVGYTAFNKFFQITQKLGQNKTHDEFARSPYYNAFVKFGSYVHNINPLYPEKFIDYVIRSGVKLDHWCKDSLYEKYVLNLIHTESVETALERSIAHMEEWAKGNSSVWHHYFKYINTNRVVYDIKDGKVSPWLILNSKSGKEMLSLLRDDQLAAISNIIDPTIWVQKFKKQTFDLELVRQVVKEASL